MSKGWNTSLRSVALALLVCASLAWSSGAEEAAPEDEVFAGVRQTVSRMLGVEEAKVGPDTDLVTDLGADPMTAFEVLAVICEENEIKLPREPNLTRVGDIVEYVRTAPRGGSSSPFGGFRGGGTKKEVHLQRVFFGTDRNRAGGSDLDQYFGPSRSAGGRIHYGTCEVSIPVGVHRRGKLERPAWWRLELTEDPRKHIVLSEIDPMDRDAFLALLDDTLQESAHNPERDVLVFVHGFNVSFAAAARRTAQMAYDLEFSGVPIFFSWPSDAKLTAYFSDREDVEWAVAHLEEFLLALKTDSSAGRINLVAHSMGNQAVIRAMYNLALRGLGDGEPLFENIILAAPDFDSHRFVDQIAPKVTSLANRWTIYASEKDFALDVSTQLAVRRLGLPVAVAGGVDTIDASGIDVAPWSVPETHGYFSSKQRVIRDLQAVLRGLGPAQRALVPASLQGRRYWALAPVDR